MTDDIKAIRDALAAGPTLGKWGLWGKPNPSQVIAAGNAFVAQTLGGNDLTNATYIAACHPERIARLLDALEQAQKDAEDWRQQHARWTQAALEMMKDAERYRWLRTFRVDSYRAGGMLNQLDAEIDAAMSDAPGA